MNDQVDTRPDALDSDGARAPGSRRRVLGAMALLAIAALSGCQRSQARGVQLGDAVAVVQEALGQDSVEYRSKAEIEASRFGHYRFENLTDDLDPLTKAAELPEVVGRALWFKHFGTAGTLVYLDERDRVTAVFWAGT